VIDNRRETVITRLYRKKTFTGLLTTSFSFTSHSYKLGLIKTLVHRVLRLNNTWEGFHQDLLQLKTILLRNMYPEHLNDKVISHVLDKYIAPNSNSANSHNSNDHNVESFYFKLPYIGNFSSLKQKSIKRPVKRYCKEINFKLVFTTNKISSLFSPKDPIPSELRTRVVYKFSCAGCNASYVDETTQHLATHVHERLSRDKASHVNKHLAKNEGCRAVCSKDSFQILDSAPTDFQLKIKEAIYIQWENPSLNSQAKQLNLCLST